MPTWQPTNAIARPTYYDRQATAVNRGYDVVVAPHAVTTRWTYTVPATRAAFIEAVTAAMLRQTAPGAGALLFIESLYTPSGGSQTPVLSLGNRLDVSGNFDSVNTTSFGYMAAGDNIIIQTGDFCTGGTVQWILGLKGTEFAR